MTNANFNDFKTEELKFWGITKFSKNRNIKSNKIQLDILNLENNGLPVNRLLDLYRMDLKVKLESLNMQLVSVQK